MGVDSYLNINRMLIHVICVPQTRVFDEVGGGSTTYVVSFPRVLQEVKFLVPECPSVAHSVPRTLQEFYVPPLPIQGFGGQRGGGTAAPLRFCGMDMPAGTLIRHQMTACCDKNTQMRWRRRDAAISSRCSEATFSLIREKEVEHIKGVEVPKYLWRMLDLLDDNWPAVLRNMQNARKMWGQLWKLLQREGGNPAISETFYHAVLQAVLLFGVETRVILAPMVQRIEGVHVGFLRQVTKLEAKIMNGGLWRKVAA